MKKIIWIIALLGFVFQNGLLAQSPDPRFSQFYASPLHLNPAMNGVFNGTIRVVANYRDQWASVLDTDPFRTIGFSFDYRHNIVSDDYFAAGISLMGDQAGTTNLQHTRGHVNLSYLKKLSGHDYNKEAQYLIAGGQIGVGQSFIDYSDVWFTSQFDMSKEEIDFTLNSNENISDNSNLYTDINAGLMWYGVFDEDFSIYFGGAINHLNRPKFTFLDDFTEEMYARWVVHAGAQIPLSRELSILPGAVYMLQGPSNSLIFGTNFRYSNQDWRELAIRIGTWLHTANELEGSTLSDALVVNGVIEYEQLQFGFSYDFNLSSLKDATLGRGGFELSVIYVSKPTSPKRKVNCPKF